MARKNTRAKARDDDRDDEGTPPPDRPDQIAINPGDEPEEISIFDTANDGDDDPPPKGTRGQGADRDDDDERAPPVESRDQRTRAEYDGSVLSRGDDDDRRDQRSSRDDDAQYSKKVQRRINREYALRRRAETRLAEERTARQQLEQRLAKLERKQTVEQSEASIREIEAKIKEVSIKLAKAKEDNDTATEVALQVELSDLQGKKVLLESQRMQITQRQDEPGTTADDADREPARPNRGRSAEWVRAQRRWWSTSRWADARNDAIQHDTTILQEIDEGELDFEPYSDEHFEELARRLKHDYPDLEVRTLDGQVFEELADDDLDDDVRDERREHMSRRDDDERGDDRRAPRGPARRAPMGGLGGRDGRRERNAVELARRGRVTLTEEDFATMRIFKLDPNNPDHKKAFARERARTLLREANNGATRR